MTNLHPTAIKHDQTVASLRLVSALYGKLKFQITNQQITIQTKFSGLKIEDIPKQNMQQCAAKFAAPDFPI